MEEAWRNTSKEAEAVTGKSAATVRRYFKILTGTRYIVAEGVPTIWFIILLLNCQKMIKMVNCLKTNSSSLKLLMGIFPHSAKYSFFQGFKGLMY